MLTLEQIHAAHSKVKSGADFPAYVQDLIELGVYEYETFVNDGHTVYKDTNGLQLSSSAKYAPFEISMESNKDEFIAALKAHQQGQTDYPQFCNDCAKSGITTWVVNTRNLTCTYFNQAAEKILEENIPS